MFKGLRRCCFVFALVALTSPFGCGDGDKEEPVSKRIVGNWQGKAQVDDMALKNLPKDEQDDMKRRIEGDMFLLSLQEGGIGKVGRSFDRGANLDDMKWMVESESGNKARITIQQVRKSDEGKIDLALQDDGSILAKVTPSKKNNGALPPYSLHLKKVDKLPEVIAPNREEKTMSEEIPVKTVEGSIE